MSTGKPDFEFDGLITTIGKVTIPCDVLIWLPRRPEDDAKVEITMRRGSRSVDVRGLVHLRAAEHVEKQGLCFDVFDILVRSGESSVMRPDAARLKLTYIGQFRIENARVMREQGGELATGKGSDSVDLSYFQVVLSSLNYGGQYATPISHYLGSRNLKYEGAPKSLRFCSPAGVYEFELQRHWHWETLHNGNSVQATSAPVLVLSTSLSTFVRDQVASLTQLGEDACTLLSLAARHRVVPHIIRYGGPRFDFAEWREPLSRQRAVTEEEATGPLVDQSELEAYFECAALWWNGLVADHKDAIRLAIFSVHRLTGSTMESEFMGMFSALEGLAKRWGTGANARAKFDSMLKTYPVRSAGLWPLFDSDGGESLYWLRNEIAHGRTVTRFSSALVVANDHLQLWLEFVLLALMGYSRKSVSADWLSAQVPDQKPQVVFLRQELRAKSLAAKRR